MINIIDKNLIIKRTYGEPKLNYYASDLRGFELKEDPFMLFTLTHEGNTNFELKIPLEHLDIKEDRFITELNIHDDDNRYLANLLYWIYEYNGVILDDVIGEEGVMYNVDMKELRAYILSISMLEMFLYFDADELVYIDLFDLALNEYSVHKDRHFKDLDDFKLNFAIDVLDRDYFNKQCGKCGF